MTQIETIIAEIERRYNQNNDKLTKIPEYCDEASILRMVCAEDLYFRDFINSLPAEQPSEELEYLATSLEETIGTSPHSRETIISYLQQAAQWQKEQMMKSAIDAKIVNDESSGCVVDCEQGCLVLEPHRYLIGQKLKILILEDKQ